MKSDFSGFRGYRGPAAGVWLLLALCAPAALRAQSGSAQPIMEMTPAAGPPESDAAAEDDEIPTMLPHPETDRIWVSGCGSIVRSEEHTSELQSHVNLVCRLLL